MGYHSGLSAEQSVAQHYTDQGYELLAQRYRTKSGEIDLIFSAQNFVVFVEVKKSRNHAAAASRIQDRQVKRINATASEFLGTLPAGQNTDCRFDVALVDGVGRVQIIENAFGA